MFLAVITGSVVLRVSKMIVSEVAGASDSYNAIITEGYKQECLRQFRYELGGSILLYAFRCFMYSVGKHPKYFLKLVAK